MCMHNKCMGCMEIWLESINFKSRRFLSSIFRFVDQKCYKNYNTLGINPAITETAFNFTNEKALTVLCSVIKHTRKKLEHKISIEINKCDIVKCFSILLERCGLFLSALQQNRAQSRLFFFALRQDFVKFRYFELILRQSIGRWHDSFSSVFYTLIKHAFSANQCMLIWTLL